MRKDSWMAAILLQKAKRHKYLTVNDMVAVDVNGLGI